MKAYVGILLCTIETHCHLKVNNNRTEHTITAMYIYIRYLLFTYMSSQTSHKYHIRKYVIETQSNSIAIRDRYPYQILQYMLIIMILQTFNSIQTHPNTIRCEKHCQIPKFAY